MDTADSDDEDGGMTRLVQEELWEDRSLEWMCVEGWRWRGSFRRSGFEASGVSLLPAHTMVSVIAMLVVFPVCCFLAVLASSVRFMLRSRTFANISPRSPNPQNP